MRVLDNSAFTARYTFDGIMKELVVLEAQENTFHGKLLLEFTIFIILIVGGVI